MTTTPAPRCSSCGAVIWWGFTSKGKRMPLDAQPAEDGNVVVDWPGGLLPSPSAAPHVRVLRKGEDAGDVPRYRSHFVTCTAAERHRKTRTP